MEGLIITRCETRNHFIFVKGLIAATEFVQNVLKDKMQVFPAMPANLHAGMNGGCILAPKYYIRSRKGLTFA